MQKIKLIFRGISEIVGDTEMGVIVLTDMASTRQIAIVCDHQMEEQFTMRIGQPPMRKLLPEVLCQALWSQGVISQFEVIITDISNGQYLASLVNTATMEMIPVRASDGVLLSFISEIPLYIEAKLMMRQSVPFAEDARGMSLPVNSISDDMLRQALDRAVADENYELASCLRDEIKRRGV